MTLAYLPQHVAEVMCLVLGGLLVAGALPMLVTGQPTRSVRGTGRLKDWAARRVRALALLLTAAGTALAIFGFVVPAEPAQAQLRNHWGSPLYEVLLGLWVAAIFGSSLYSLKRRR